MPNPLATITPDDFLTELGAFRLELDRKQDIIAARDAEIARLREALGWYANPHHWEEDNWRVPAVVISPEYGNPGQMARDALAKNEWPTTVREWVDRQESK